MAESYHTVRFAPIVKYLFSDTKRLTIKLFRLAVPALHPGNIPQPHKAADFSANRTVRSVR